MLAETHKGFIKACMIEAMKKSSERYVRVAQKPNVNVVTKRAFKPGAFTLVGASPHIALLKDTQGGKPQVAFQSQLPIGILFKHEQLDVRGYVKPYLQFPKAATTASSAIEGCLVPFWAAQPTKYHMEANFMRELKEMTVKVGSTSYSIKIPIIVNHKELNPNDHVP